MSLLPAIRRTAFCTCTLASVVQPNVLSPSNSKSQPSAISFGVNVLGFTCSSALACKGNRTNTVAQMRLRMVQSLLYKSARSPGLDDRDYLPRFQGHRKGLPAWEKYCNRLK